MRVAILKALTAALFFAAVAAAQTWDCGATRGTVTCTLGGDGVLTVSGAGAMADYYDIEYSPWYADSLSPINSIVIGDGVTSVGDRAFVFTGSTSVTIPNSVISIGEMAFAGSFGLKSIIIPNSVASIGMMAFALTGLTSVTIPQNVRSIGMLAFANCSTLTSVTIDEGVTSIGAMMFLNCVSLTSITIPNSVTSIGVLAFKNCVSLKSVVCLMAVPPDIAHQSVFDSVDVSSVCLYVPEESTGAYGSAAVWKDFGCIKPLGERVSAVSRARVIPAADPFGIVVNGASFQIAGISRATPVRIYDMRGRVLMSRTAMPNERISVSHLAKGIYVIRAVGKSVRLAR